MTGGTVSLAALGESAVGFYASVSHRACLFEWTRPLDMTMLFALLAELNNARTTAGRVSVLVVSVRGNVPTPSREHLNALRGTLAAVFDLCENVCVAFEETKNDRTLVRAAFVDVSGRTHGRPAPLFFDSLSAALTNAQRFAPHDVLELQRYVMRRSIPPS